MVPRVQQVMPKRDRFMRVAEKGRSRWRSAAIEVSVPETTSNSWSVTTTFTSKDASLPLPMLRAFPKGRMASRGRSMHRVWTARIVSMGCGCCVTLSTLVDSLVRIDILRPSEGGMRPRSLASSDDAPQQDDIVFGEFVRAECRCSPLTEDILIRSFADLSSKREAFPFAAADPAGRAHRPYRERGGRRVRTRPDFPTGAHATVGGHRFPTGDASRDRGYRPEPHIIAPDNRP